MERPDSGLFFFLRLFNVILTVREVHGGYGPDIGFTIIEDRAKIASPEWPDPPELREGGARHINVCMKQ